MESVGHEPLVRLPCKIFCMVHERVVHARLIPKILFAQGPPTIRGSFARGSWTEDPWCNNSCDWKGCPRKAVGKTSRAEAQAKTRGTRHGVCDCSFAEKKEQAQRRVGCLFIFGKHRDHHHLNYLWTSFVSFSSVSVLGSFSLIVFLQQKG